MDLAHASLRPVPSHEERRMDVRLKRAYESAESADGYRVLIDRLWPRGLARAGKARRLGEGAATEHGAEAVVRARAQPL
jgi:hypothetical protein